MKNLSERLEWLFKTTGRKAAEASRSLGIDAGYISHLRKGDRTELGPDKIQALSQFFGCDSQWLATGTGDAKLSAPQETEPRYGSKKLETEVVERLAERPESIAERMTDDELLEAIKDWGKMLEEQRHPKMKSAIASNLSIFAAELSRRSQIQSQSQ